MIKGFQGENLIQRQSIAQQTGGEVQGGRRAQGFTHKQVVTDATGHLPQSVGIERSHQHKVCPPPKVNVENWVGPALPHLARRKKWGHWEDHSVGGGKEVCVCRGGDLGGGSRGQGLIQEPEEDHLMSNPAQIHCHSFSQLSR